MKDPKSSFFSANPKISEKPYVNVNKIKLGVDLKYIKLGNPPSDPQNLSSSLSPSP
jgi:hypothetical protein